MSGCCRQWVQLFSPAGRSLCRNQHVIRSGAPVTPTRLPIFRHTVWVLLQEALANRVAAVEKRSTMLRESLPVPMPEYMAHEMARWRAGLHPFQELVSFYISCAQVCESYGIVRSLVGKFAESSTAAYGFYGLHVA